MFKVGDKKLWIITNVLTYIFYLYIAVCIPYTHDDWDWGLSVGLEQLKNASLNSRYAGNFFAVIMTRSELIKNIIISVVAWGIPYTYSGIISKSYKEKTVSFLLCNVFVMLMPVEMWAQTYGWVSGFANYVISLLCIGIFIRMCNGSDEPITGRLNARDIFFFVFVVISQLFLENISIYFFLVSIFICVVAIKKQTHKRKYAIMMAANIIGLIIMFSSNIYGELFKKGETLTHLVVVRKFSFDMDKGVFSVARNVLDNFVTIRLVDVWRSTKWLVLIVLLVVFLIIQKNKTNLAKKYKLAIIAELATLFVYLGMLFNLTVVNENRTTDIFFGLFYIWFIFFVLFIICSVTDKKVKYTCVFSWISAFLFVVPLSAILENGPRLYLASYMFIITTVIELIIYIFKDSSFEFKIKPPTVLGIVVFGLFVHRFYVYTDIYLNTCNSREQIQNVIKNNSDELHLNYYNYEEYLWGEYPVDDERIDFYKKFYHIPEEVEIIYE